MRAQFGLVLSGFLALISASTCVGLWASHTLADDARRITLASHQRLLAQHMVWLTTSQPGDPSLADDIRLFSLTLRALRDGGLAQDAAGRPVSLPPVPDAALRAQLDQMSQDWQVFEAHAFSTIAPTLAEEASSLTGDIDGVISTLEARAKTSLIRFQLIQLTFLASAIGLAVYTYALTQSRILRPLSALETAARHMVGGNLSDPVPPGRDDEIGRLARSLDAIRVGIASAQGELEAGRRQAEHAATLAERERLAADLHDNLAQTLSYLNLETERTKEMLAGDQRGPAAAELEKVSSAIGQAYGQVRAALVELREPVLKAGDFPERLAAVLAQFRETSGLPAELSVSDPAALALPQATQIQVLHIVREALANTQRHAQAQHATVRVERVADATHVITEDDGRGFDPHALAGEGHLGLAIMRARAERSGGQLVVDSAPAAGTRVIAIFPLGTPRSSAWVGTPAA